MALCNFSKHSSQQHESSDPQQSILEQLPYNRETKEQQKEAQKEEDESDPEKQKKERKGEEKLKKKKNLVAVVCASWIWKKTYLALLGFRLLCSGSLQQTTNKQSKERARENERQAKAGKKNERQRV